MTKRTKINRPLNLSQWFFFATYNDQSFDKLAGGNREYILRVRAANKPVICLKQNKSGKYRWTLGRCSNQDDFG